MLKKQQNFLSIPNFHKKRAVTFEKSTSSVKISPNQSFIIQPQVEEVQSFRSDFKEVPITFRVQAQLKTIKWPSKIINDNDMAEMKRLSKPLVHKPLRIKPKGSTTSEREILQRKVQRRKQQMQTLDDELKEKIVKDIEEKTNDFMQFAKDQGAFDWQRGSYKDVQMPKVSKSIDITKSIKDPKSEFLKPQLQRSQDQYSNLPQNKPRISFKLSNVDRSITSFERAFESLKSQETPRIDYNIDLKQLSSIQITNNEKLEVEVTQKSGMETMDERKSPFRIVDDSKYTKKKLSQILDMYGLQQTSQEWMNKRKQTLEPKTTVNIQVFHKSASNLPSPRVDQPLLANPFNQQSKLKSTFLLEGTRSTTPAGDTADVTVESQKLRKDSPEVQFFDKNRRNQFYQISAEELNLKQMPKLLQKYQKRVEEHKTQAVALEMNIKRRKIVKSTVKSYFNNNYEEQKKGLEQELREIKMPTTMFKERPSSLYFKPKIRKNPVLSSDRTKQKVYVNEEDRLLDRMTQIAAQHEKNLKQITEPPTANKIGRLKTKSDSSNTNSGDKLSFNESDDYTENLLDQSGSYKKSQKSSFKEKSRISFDFSTIAMMEELSLQIKKGIAKMFQQKIDKKTQNDKSKLKPAMEKAIDAVKSKLEQQISSRFHTQPSRLQTQQSRQHTQQSDQKLISSDDVTAIDQPKLKEPTTMQLKFRAAIMAKFSGEMDQQIEKKFGRQNTLMQNEQPSDVKEPQEADSQSREGINKKFEWFKEQFGKDSLNSGNFNKKRAIFMQAVKHLVFYATSKVAETMSKRRLLRQEAAKDEASWFNAMKQAEIRKTQDEEILREAWDQFVDMFQNFVLVFSNVQFTKGKRRMLLFLIIKLEADIFQELREYDRAIKAYKALLTYCELWKFKEPIINLNEQIGMCYRLMRLHSAAVDCFKMQLQHAWANKDYEQELKCYNLISQEYYYIGEMEKMKIYYDRYTTGTVASDQSLTKKSAIIAVQSFKPSFDVFQNQRRGLSMRDEEKITDFSKSKDCQCLPHTQFAFISKKQRQLIEKLNIINPKQLANITIPEMFRPLIKSNILDTNAKYTKIDLEELKEIEAYMLQREKQEFQKQIEFQKEADKIETQSRRKTNRLKFSNMGYKELKDYKISNYSVANLNDRREYSTFDDEKYAILVKSARDQQFYGGNMVDINWQHPYRGQQSTLRFQQLHEVEDHTQLKTIKAMFKKMESEMNRLLDNFYEDSKQDFELKMKLLRGK